MDNNSAAKASGQYLTFRLGEEIFAFDVLRINEVLEVTQITRIPGASDAMVGVINLRGSVVPVVDLRKKLNLPPKEHSIDTAIIIIDTEYSEDKVTLGVLVDAAKKVIMLDEKQLEPPPKVGMKLNIDYITAIGKHDDGFIILLNSEKIFSQEELVTASETREVQV